MSNTRKLKPANPRVATNPAKAEATAETIVFEFHDVTYRVPPTIQWPVDVLEAVEDGRITHAVRELVGADGWAAFKATQPTAGDLNGLMEALGQAAGLQGN